MKSHRKRALAKRVEPAPSEDVGEWWRSWLLAAVMALCVARPLLPSEGVSWLGDGQPFDMLWLVIAGGYLLLAMVRGRLARPPDLVDAGVGALVLISVASALVGARNLADARELSLTGTGSPRLTINMLFEWVALGLTFFLTRQLVRTPREARALVAVMIALAVVLSAYGFYQVFVGLPAARAEYAANPDQVLQRMNQWYPPDSPERLRFENRLQSTEPMATFALTNSLAGFFVPWLVVTLGIALSMLKSRRDAACSREREQGTQAQRQRAWWRLAPTARFAGLAACILLVMGCFVLTKSRSGYVALAVGVALLPLLSDQGRRIFNWKAAVVGVAALVAIVGGAVAVKGLDAAVITEASKSLGFRLQYWQSTLAMIGKYPWLGVGPGNFQDYYTQFKLPQASEEIRDPHNFLLEVWATGGTFALVALGGILAMFAWRTCQTTARPAAPAAPAQRCLDESTRSVKFMVGGAAGGFVIAFLIGPLVGLAFSEEQVAGGLVVGGAVVAILWPWVIGGTLPRGLPALAVLALAVHLLASGGIAFPGVAGTFWILLALALGQAEEEPPEQKPRAQNAAVPRPLATALAPGLAPRLALIAALAVVSSAAVACYILAFRPVLSCRAAMAKADESPDMPTRVKAYLEAARGDPLSAEPWTAIAELELERLRKDPQAVRAFQDFAYATERISELRPHSSSAWRQTGRWYSELYSRTHSAEAANTAVDCFRNAVELYPNLATLRGEYALALQATGQTAAARRHATDALQLDGQTPHADKKLSPALKQQLEALLAEPR